MGLEVAKSVAAGIAVGLALLQGLAMLQVQGKGPALFPFEKQVLRRWHRRGGVAALGLMTAVAAACVLGEGIYAYPFRVWVHAVAGTLAILVLLVKVVFTHRTRRLVRYNGLLGRAAGLLILIAFLASVAGYYLSSRF
ncbi:MAG TPA: hypothetical protein ENK08_06160 [Chloroflexi bacterium]|nr:hypothetical protein [Chloroflexota bacterium]